MISEINVTPLVDVILVLLIIFMVVTEVIHETEKPEGIELDLPSAETGQQSGATDPVVVGVTPNGSFTFNGQTVEKDEVVRKVKDAIARKGADLEIRVSADEEAPHKRFVTLLDVLRGAGVARILIETIPPEAPASVLTP